MAVKSEELRLGNYVTYDGETGVVSEILKGYIDFSYKSNLGNTITLHSCPCEDVSPIPLTEEILLKCGFRKESDLLLFLPMPKIKAEIHWEKNSYGNVFVIHSFGRSEFPLIPDDIEFLHQLQNLIHSLCGEKMEVSL